jgi:hypothetical protein
MSQDANTSPRPVEEIAGDVMQGLQQIALRCLKQRDGEAAALAALDQLEAGAAQMLVRLVIRAQGTHIVAHLNTADGAVVPLADFEIIPPPRHAH